MFKRWKEEAEKRRQRDEAIQADAYLRRLRNSASMLSGLSHSGNGEELNHTLEIYEVRSILRAALKTEQEKQA